MSLLPIHMKDIDYVYNQFSTVRFPLPSEEQLLTLEKHIGIALPGDYREFVLKYNGGYFNEPEIRPSEKQSPPAMLTCLYGIGASHSYAELAQPSSLVLFDDNDPPKILPIGDTPTGGLVLLVTEPEGRGEIFLKMPFGDFFYLANGIGQFFELLRQRPGSE